MMYPRDLKSKHFRTKLILLIKQKSKYKPNVIDDLCLKNV